MDIANLDQAEHWNTSAGHWLDDQAKYDGMLAPFIPMLLDGAGISSSARTLDDAVAFLANGSLARTLLAGADDTTRANALDARRAALAPHVTDEGVRVDSAVWLATATA